MDSSPRVKKIKAKIKKWSLIKLKSVCTEKETIKGKRQSVEWKKIFTMEVIVKTFNSKIYKQINIKYKPVRNWAEYLNDSLQKKTQMANRHMKRCSISQIIGEMQIKTTVRYHLKPVRMALIKKKKKKICK